MRRRPVLLAAVASASLWLPVASARAQDSAGAASASPTAPASADASANAGGGGGAGADRPVAIGLNAIAGAAADLDALLRTIDDDIGSSDEQESIAAELPDLERDARSRVRRGERRLAAVYDADDLDAMDTSWRASDADLARRESALADHLAALDAHRAELERQDAIWKATADAAGEQRAPAELTALMSKSRRSLGAAQRRLRKGRDRALALQQRVTALRALASAHRDAITRAREEVLRGLLRRNEAPIWSADFAAVEFQREHLSTTLGEVREAAEGYARRRGGLLFFHGLVIAFLVWASGRSAETLTASHRAGDRPVPAALARPYAAGFVLGLTATAGMHAEAPAVFRQLPTLIVLPFWFLVLRGLLPDPLRRPLLGLLALVLFDLLRRALIDIGPIARLLLLVETVGVFTGILWLRRPARLGAIPHMARLAWTRLLGIWLYIAMVVSGAAAMAALAGWTGLASTAIRGVATGSFVASVLFTAVRVLEGIAEAAPGGLLAGVRLIRTDPQAFGRVVSRTARVFALFAWVYSLLYAVGIQDAAFGALQAGLATPLGYGNVQVSLGGLLAFAVAIWVSWIGSRFAAALLEHEIFPRVSMPRGVPFALATISRYAVLTFGFVVAVAALGFEVSNLALLLSALGVGIGFGLQHTVNNFISGLMLLFERPIKVGDRISVDSVFGNVTRIGIRASVLRTVDGADVIIPNGELISNRVTNWTLADTRRRVSLSVGVAYGTPARRVIELLEVVARANDDVLSDPPPMALFVGFGDSSLDFELRVWTESENALTLVRSAVAVAIQDALAEADIEVPFPQRDLHVKGAGEA